MVLTMRLGMGGDLIQFPQLIFLEDEDKRVIFQERTLISEKNASWLFNSFRRHKFSSIFCTKRKSSVSCALSGKLIQYVECV